MQKRESAVSLPLVLTSRCSCATGCCGVNLTLIHKNPYSYETRYSAASLLLVPVTSTFSVILLVSLYFSRYFPIFINIVQSRILFIYRRSRLNFPMALQLPFIVILSITFLYAISHGIRSPPQLT